MGGSILRLEDGAQEAGNYSLTFNPADYSLPKGVYHCRITVQGNSENYNEMLRIVYVK